MSAINLNQKPHPQKLLLPVDIVTDNSPLEMVNIMARSMDF